MFGFELSETMNVYNSIDGHKRKKRNLGCSFRNSFVIGEALSRWRPMMVHGTELSPRRSTVVRVRMQAYQEFSL